MRPLLFPGLISRLFDLRIWKQLEVLCNGRELEEQRYIDVMEVYGEWHEIKYPVTIAAWVFRRLDLTESECKRVNIGWVVSLFCVFCKRTQT